jgi:hypothetical protein
MRKRSLWILVLALALGATGVVVWRVTARTAADGPSSSAVVGAGGVLLEFEGITVRGPADVAPPGTVLTASRTAEAPTGRALELATATGLGVTLSLGGLQPAAPLTVTMPLDRAPGADEAGVLVTRPGGSSDTLLIPATYSAERRTVTAEVRHLSDFWAGMTAFSRMADSIGGLLTQTLGISSPRPSCTAEPAETADGSPVTVSGYDFSATASPVVWPCVVIDGDTASVTLVANTPLPWRTTPEPDAELAAAVDLDVSKAVTLAAFRTLMTDRPYREGLIVPGASVTYRFPVADLPGEIRGKADPLTLAGMVLLLGLDLVVKTFGIDTKDIAGNVEAITCVGDAVEAARADGKPIADGVAALARAVLSCLGTVARALGGVLATPVELVLTLIAGGVSLLAGNLMGILASVLDVDEFTIVVERKTTATKVVNVVAAKAGEPAAGYVAGAPAQVPIEGCTPSRSAVSPDIVSCGSTAAGADICWVAPNRTSLLCGTDPWKKELLSYSVTAPVPPKAPEANPWPWAMTLADGSQCRIRNGGSWPGRADRYVGAYGCQGASEFVLVESGDVVDRTSPLWTVKVGALGADNEDFPPPIAVAVETAYFAST